MVLNALKRDTLPLFALSLGCQFPRYFWRTPGTVFCSVGNCPKRLPTDRTGLQMVIPHNLRLECLAVPILQEYVTEESANQRLCNHLGALYNLSTVQ